MSPDFYCGLAIGIAGTMVATLAFIALFRWLEEPHPLDREDE